MASENNEMKNVQIHLPERVDTFNLDSILSQVKEGLAQSPSEVVLDLGGTRFINLPFIKKLAQIALEAQNAGKSIALLNASEKVKMQIGIFSDIKIFQIKREPSKRVWPALDESADF